MEEYYRAGHEKLKQMVSLHQETISHLLQMLIEKQNAETGFWSSLRKNLKEVKR